MNKIFISPERRVKPHGKYWGMEVYEHDVCCEIAALLKPLLEHNGFAVMIALPDWTMEQRAAYANQNGFAYYLCIHTNAAGDGRQEGTATGAECLYYNHPDSIRANQLVYQELTALYPSRRGCKDYSNFAENNLTHMVSCYPELGFHDNDADARWIVEHKPKIAQALCNGVCKYFNIDVTPSDTQTTYTAAEYNAVVDKLEALDAKHTRMTTAVVDTINKLKEVME